MTTEALQHCAVLRGKPAVAKQTCSGLAVAEIARVDAIDRKTTVESGGPVGSVWPTLVLELGGEAIARSTRQESGMAVRFPRAAREQDKPAEEGDSLQTLAALLPS